MGITYDKDSLVVEQSNYTNKTANVCIVYDWDAWSRNSTNKFKFKNAYLAQLI